MDFAKGTKVEKVLNKRRERLGESITILVIIKSNITMDKYHHTILIVIRE
jgi:hypothetical protein